MEASLMVLWAVVALLFLAGFVSLAVLPGWFRARRQEAVWRQIALTEALDGELGPIVSPVVKRPLLGPWRIEIAVPLAQFATVGRLLAVAHETLSDREGMSPSQYRIILSARPDSGQRGRGPQVRKNAERWAGNPAAA
jgi:hypothetical protein